MRIVILTRGSAKEGLGHLVRAQAFARVAQKQHQVEIIAITDHRLIASARYVADEASARQVLGRLKADVIVFDLTTIERGTFDVAQAIAPLTVSISPIFAYMHNIDLLFTRGEAPAACGDTKIFAGLDYAIISDSCFPISEDRFRISLADPVLSVGIAMGGGDAANDTLKILQAITRVDSPLRIRICLGPGYVHPVAALENLLPDKHRLLIMRGNGMWEDLQDCAVGVFTGGLTVLEAVYAGLPVVRVKRENDASKLVAKNYDDLLFDGGDLVSDSYLDKLPAVIYTLYANREVLQTCRQKQQGLIDGRGAERVMQEIEKFCLAKPVPTDKIMA